MLPEAAEQALAVPLLAVLTVMHLLAFRQAAVESLTVMPLMVAPAAQACTVTVLPVTVPAPATLPEVAVRATVLVLPQAPMALADRPAAPFCVTARFDLFTLHAVTAPT